jgi:hypothetical protein
VQLDLETEIAAAARHARHARPHHGTHMYTTGFWGWWLTIHRE